VQNTLPDEQLVDSSQPTQDDSASEAETKSSHNSDEEPEGKDIKAFLLASLINLL
jgi:hypothetical protein